MASKCLFTCSVLQDKSSFNRNRCLDVCKPLCPSKSKSMVVCTMAQPSVRRSANYKPSLWSFDYVQSQTSKYTGEDYTARADALKESVKILICKTSNNGNPVKALELVDHLQRLGISYHYKEEIRDMLETLYDNYYKTQNKWHTMDLNMKSLGFRLLRQHGYQVSEDILYNFKDNTQNLKPEDMVSMLNLYEASYYSFEDEIMLDDARDFSAKYLREKLDKIEESTIASLVSHALELPLHWRVPRVEAKWFIEVYETSNDMNPTLIELAKLDFGMLQAIHLEDLKHCSRWWRNLDWDKNLSFARDRLVENFLWTVGVCYLPQFSLGRRTLTRVNAIITSVDDVYDVYGTLDELEKFTDVIERWDINGIEELPDYMKICFLGFYNTINEIAYNTLTNTGFLVLPYLKKAWTNLCKSYLVEARWYHNKYSPTLQEYLDNAWVSISAPAILMHVNFLTSTGSFNEILRNVDSAYNIVHYSSLILRLADDLGTSSDEIARGDTPKAIQCYMHENDATEDEARTYIKTLIIDTWKKINKERASINSQFSQEFHDCATNLGRMAQFMYSKGDGHGEPHMDIKSYELSLLFIPIQGIP